MMHNFRKVLLGTAAMAVAAGFAAVPAAAQDAKVVASGSEKVKLTLSGQVSRQATFIDDGEASTIRHLDNDYAPSAFRIEGTAAVNRDVSAGMMLELGITPNNASASNQDAANNNSGGASTHEARIVEIFFAHDRFGTVYMGKGHTGSDGVSELNLSMLGVTMLPMGNSLAFGGAEFRVPNHAGRGANTVAVNAVLTEFVGMGRLNRVRYDSPTVMGTQLRATHADQGEWDVSAWHESTIGGFDVAAAIGYAQATRSGDYTGMVSGSVSVMSPWGIGVHAGAGQRDLNVSTVSPWGFGAGVTYETQFSELGKTGVGYMYQRVKDERVNGFSGTTATSHQVALVQAIDAASTDVFLSWTRFDLNTRDSFAGGAYVAGSGSGIQGVDYQAIDVVSLGATVKF